MNNLISHDFMDALKILVIFLSLYAILFWVLTETGLPKLKKFLK